MKPSCSAKRNQRELSRIASALDRDHANRLLHRCVDHPDHARGKFFQLKIRTLLLQPLFGDIARTLEVQREVAAKKAGCLQPSEEKICVRHRRLQTASITDWSRIRSRRLRPDAQYAGCVEARQRSSTCPNRMDVEHGHTHGKAGDLSLIRGLDFPLYQRNIRRRPAHVECNDVFKAATPRAGRSAYYASGWTREHCSHRLLRCARKRRDPSRGLHHENSRSICLRCTPSLRAFISQADYCPLQIVQISLHHWLQVSIDDDGGRAFVFPKFGQDLMRNRERRP